MQKSDSQTHPHIFIADTTPLQHETIIARYLQRVSPYRRQKLSQYRFIADKAQSLGAWLLFHEGLRQLNIDISNHSIVLNAYGKPSLSPCDCYFNLSHTHHRAMAILAASEVGCDIEYLSDPDSEIACHCFSPQENTYYDSLPPDKKRKAFFRIWTAREAFLKAIGRGLSDPVPLFSVISNDGLFTPVLTYENRTFWGQGDICDDYAWAWWLEVKSEL